MTFRLEKKTGIAFVLRLSFVQGCKLHVEVIKGCSSASFLCSVTPGDLFSFLSRGYLFSSDEL